MADRVVVGGVEVNPLAIACSVTEPEIVSDGIQYDVEIWLDREHVMLEMFDYPENAPIPLEELENHITGIFRDYGLEAANAYLEILQRWKSARPTRGILGSVYSEPPCLPLAEWLMTGLDRAYREGDYTVLTGTCEGVVRR